MKNVNLKNGMMFIENEVEYTIDKIFVTQRIAIVTFFDGTKIDHKTMSTNQIDILMQSTINSQMVDNNTNNFIKPLYLKMKDGSIYDVDKFSDSEVLLTNKMPDHPNMKQNISLDEYQNLVDAGVFEIFY